MPIKFEYLEDGTPFVAKELNTRFTDAADTINAIDEDNMALGALRTEHVPPPVGVAGKIEEPLFGGPLYKMSSHSLLGYNSNSLLKFVTGGIVPGLSVQFSPSIDVFDTTSTGPHVDAFIILVNINVNRVLPYGDGDTVYSKDKAIDDLINLTFGLVAQGTNDTIKLPWTRRSISPGYCVGGVEYAAYGPGGGNPGVMPPGTPFKDDNFTDKDVAIRSVVLPSDLEGIGNLKSFSIDYQMDTYGLTNKVVPVASSKGDPETMSRAIEINKASLTVIPVHSATGLST